MRKGIIAVLLVLIAVLVGAYFYLDRVIASAIERSAQEALGVDTHVEAASLGLWTGVLDVHQFTAQNPPGMTDAEPYFLAMQEGRFRMPLTVLWRDTVHVPEITLTGLVFNLEQEGPASNYRSILQHLDAHLAADPEAGPALFVDDLHLRNVTVNLSVSADVADLPDVATLQATVPALHLQDVGDEENGASPAHLTALVVTSVLQAVAESEQALPAVIRQPLLALLEDLPRVPVQIEGEIAWTGTDALRRQVEGLLEEGADLLDRNRNVLAPDTTE